MRALAVAMLLAAGGWLADRISWKRLRREQKRRDALDRARWEDEGGTPAPRPIS